MQSRGDPRRPSAPPTLTIQPPQISRPTLPHLTTPESSTSPSLISPRRAPLPPSPAFSNHSSFSGVSGVSGLSHNDPRSRKNSFDTSSVRRSFEGAPPVPRKGDKDKRLPGIPGLSGSGPLSGMMPSSPHRRAGTDGRYGIGAGAGMYDTKLVSSTLSTLAPIAPISPTPTGNSSFANIHSTSAHMAPNSKSVYSGFNPSRPSLASSAASSSSGVVVLPDGTALSTSAAEGEIARGDGQRSIKETLAHSSPSSPWSLLTIHSLPIFAGSPLKSSIEDLNQLCHSHILGTSQRTAPSRLVAVLSSDLRDFIASGMLTLKAKIETVDESRLIAKTAEIWTFFWTHVLSYLEGVFLPFSQMRDLPSTSSNTAASQPIPVRTILLSGFLVHILLPLLPRLIPIVTINQSAAAALSSDAARLGTSPSLPDLQRVLPMSLVLSTTARHSSFFPFQADEEREGRDLEVKDNVSGLGNAVRWRMSVMDTQGRPGDELASAKSPADWTPRRASLQRGLSLTQAGRHRRKGWRASSFGQGVQGAPPSTAAEGTVPTRQNSDFFQPESRWGRPRVDEEDEDDTTPGQSMMTSRQNSFAVTSDAPSTASTLTAGTWREGEFGESQRTPQADFSRRPGRADSMDSQSGSTPVMDPRRGQRV